MAIGFAALALAGYRKVKKDSARIGRAPRVTVGSVLNFATAADRIPTDLGTKT